MLGYIATDANIGRAASVTSQGQTTERGGTRILVVQFGLPIDGDPRPNDLLQLVATGQSRQMPENYFGDGADYQQLAEVIPKSIMLERRKPFVRERLERPTKFCDHSVNAGQGKCRV